MSPGLFARGLTILLASTASLAGATAGRDDPEEIFRHVWSQPFKPIGDDAVTNLPDVARLHRDVASRPPREGDAARQAAVRATFRTAGVFAPPYRHARVTCRAALCESAIIYADRSRTPTDREITDAVGKATSTLCAMPACRPGMVIASSRRKDEGLALLIYYKQVR